MRRLAPLAVVATLAVAATAAATAGDPHSEMARMMAAMDAAQMTGDPDHDFLAMMIPHHEGAVAMAQQVLGAGHDPLVRQLAEEIIASQQAEIASMRARLRLLESGALDQYPAVSGTRGR